MPHNFKIRHKLKKKQEKNAQEEDKFKNEGRFAPILMTYYFNLMRKLLGRHLSALGVAPELGVVLAAAAFLLFSALVFSRLEFAAWIYFGMAVFAAGSLNARERNYFLKTVYRRADYLKIRWIENATVLLPFCLFLAFKMAFLQAFLLIPIAFVLPFLGSFEMVSRVLPTPFSRFPFEFTTGFRKSFLWIAGVYVLLGIGMAVDNFNLGWVAMIALLLICSNFYSAHEPEQFVTIFALDPKAFLREKMRIMLLYSSLLSVPAALALLVFYPANILYIILGWCFAGLFVLAVMLSKYAFFPKNIQLPDAILLGLSFLFPPLLIGLNIWYYRKSLQNLQHFL